VPDRLSRITIVKTTVNRRVLRVRQVKCLPAFSPREIST